MSQPSIQQILTAVLLSFGAAALLLITLILPAEFDLDPLGTGKLLGIKGMSSTPSALATQQGELHIHQISFTLAPFESVEYKYRLKTGEVMLYNWSAPVDVVADMHSEPDDGPKGYAMSFLKASLPSHQGAYVAPFDGIHGWFFENRSMKTTVVTLETTGFFGEAILFRDGFETIEQF